jgi:hypothetical protein
VKSRKDNTKICSAKSCITPYVRIALHFGQMLTYFTEVLVD